MEQEGIGRQQQWPSGSGSSKIKKTLLAKPAQLEEAAVYKGAEAESEAGTKTETEAGGRLCRFREAKLTLGVAACAICPKQKAQGTRQKAEGAGKA